MRPRGPESDEERKLREWFTEQQSKNLDRLDEGAKTLTQLITGLYGVLFALLTLSDNPTPAYLTDLAVRWLASLAIGTFFLALLAALAVQYPRANRYEEDNLSSMRKAQDQMRRRKAWALRVALLSFLLGMGLLGALVTRALWIL